MTGPWQYLVMGHQILHRRKVRGNGRGGSNVQTKQRRTLSDSHTLGLLRVDTRGKACLESRRGRFVKDRRSAGGEKVHMAKRVRKKDRIRVRPEEQKETNLPALPVGHEMIVCPGELWLLSMPVKFGPIEWVGSGW